MGGVDSGWINFVRSPALDSAAMYHAKWLSRFPSGIENPHLETKSFSDQKALLQCTDRAIKFGATAYAENLIQFCPYSKKDGKIDILASAKLAFEGWEESPGHLANMLLRISQDLEGRIGLAVVPRDSNYFIIVMIVGENLDYQGNVIK